MSTDPEPQSMWRHVKTRGLYSVDGFCMIEATMQRGVIYTAQRDGTVWVRPLAEFMDGRFTPIEDDN